jgi:hypothetical protein
MPIFRAAVPLGRHLGRSGSVKASETTGGAGRWKRVDRSRNQNTNFFVPRDLAATREGECQAEKLGEAPLSLAEAQAA